MEELDHNYLLQLTAAAFGLSSVNPQTFRCAQGQASVFGLSDTFRKLPPHWQGNDVLSRLVTLPLRLILKSPIPSDIDDFR